MNPNIPDVVRRLVHAHLPTMDHVDILLFLVRIGPEARSAAEIAPEVAVDADAVSPLLQELVRAGLVLESTARGEARYRYAPADVELQGVVAELVEAHRTKPVSLIRAVYDRPSADAARQFADAFRIRKKP